MLSLPGYCCLISVGINQRLAVSVSQTFALTLLLLLKSLSLKYLIQLNVWSYISIRGRQVIPVASALTAVLLEVAEVAAGAVVTSDSRGEGWWIMSWPRCSTSGCPAEENNPNRCQPLTAFSTGPRLLLKLQFRANYWILPLSHFAQLLACGVCLLVDVCLWFCIRYIFNAQH